MTTYDLIQIVAYGFTIGLLAIVAIVLYLDDRYPPK